MDEKPFSLNTRVCRICPSEEFLIDLYLPTNLEVREVLNLFVSIEDEISTKLPKFICETCKHIVGSIIEFRDTCQERDTKLREKHRIFEENDLKNLIKIEEMSTKESFPIEEITVKEEDGECEFLEEFLEEENSQVVKLPIKRDRSVKKDHNCSFCKKVYSSYSELIEHKNKDHLQCPVCLRVFTTFRIMSKHNRNSHAGDTYCLVCGKHIPNRFQLAQHTRKFHNNERNHKCDICDKAFFHASKLKDHLTIHNELVTEICDFENCGKMFKSVINLKQHQAIHYKADDGNVKRVTKSGEPSKKQLPKIIICQCCGKILKSTSGYDLHMKVHRNEKPFECKDCDKIFRDKGSLKRHDRIHKNIRPYQCDLCPMSFTILNALKNHKISIHETEMKHECQICGKRTKIKSNLTLHMRTHGIGIKKIDLD